MKLKKWEDMENWREYFFFLEYTFGFERVILHVSFRYNQYYIQNAEKYQRESN